MNQINQCGCQCDCMTNNKNNTSKTLIINWQRSVDGGSTCPRCGSTEDELDKAVDQLRKKLKSLDVDVILEKTKLTIDEFKKDPIKSNQILFNGIPLEDIIDAKTGQSQCCDVCGDEECRTVEISGQTHETILAEMIVRAGLKVPMDL